MRSAGRGRGGRERGRGQRGRRSGRRGRGRGCRGRSRQRWWGGRSRSQEQRTFRVAAIHSIARVHRQFMPFRFHLRYQFGIFQYESKKLNLPAALFFAGVIFFILARTRLWRRVFFVRHEKCLTAPWRKWSATAFETGVHHAPHASETVSVSAGATEAF